MANKSVVRLDDSRFPNTDIYSVRGTVILENGFVGKLGEVEAGNPDVRKLEKPAAGDKLVLIANPAIAYDNTRLGANLESEYNMAAGEAVRAYKPHATYIYSVTKEAINGTPVVGEYLIAGDGYKLVPSATPAEAGFTAKIIRKDAVGGKASFNVTQAPQEYFVLDVIAN